MIRDLLNAEVAPGVTLKDVPKSARSAELEFLIPISASLTAKRLVSELKAMDPKYDFGTLRPEDLKGFLRDSLTWPLVQAGAFTCWTGRATKFRPKLPATPKSHVCRDGCASLPPAVSDLLGGFAAFPPSAARRALARRNDWRRHLCVSSRRTGRHDDSGQPSGYCFRSGASRGDSTHG